MIKGRHMVHDELVEAGASAMPKTLSRRARETWAAIVLDAVEPLIRADEREAFGITLSGMEEKAYAQGGHNRLADLRAKVEALRDNAKEWQEKSPVQSPWTAYVGAYNHVLDLIDGGSDV